MDNDSAAKAADENELKSPFNDDARYESEEQESDQSDKPANRLKDAREPKNAAAVSHRYLSAPRRDEGSTATATPLSDDSDSRSFFSETPATQTPSVADNIFEPQPPPLPKIIKNIKPPAGPRAPDPTRRDSEDSQSTTSSDGGQATASESAARASAVSRPEAVEDSPAVPQPEVKREQKQLIDAATLTRGARNIKIQKFLITFGLVVVNFMFIFACWWWPQWWYLYLPFISFPLVLNCIMIASITVCKLRNTIRPEKVFEPANKESLIKIIPCYNETAEECTKSLDSLVDQDGLEEHNRAIVVICDGRVRGPGMEKTTADYLNEDILLNQTRREKFMDAYTGWNGQSMDIEVSMGLYKGVPFYCIVKEQNQGKRDSLIVVRSFLYKHNLRATNPTHIFSQQFFDSFSSWLGQDVGMNHVDHLIGMDADTVFDRTCIRELLKESKYANTVGVCGYVAVDFSGGSWNLWALYQSAEYTIAQGLRRLHQSIATHKVSCLPGCVQLLKICETTCGDHVLIKLFGYHPSPLDHMLKQIRATASEDRNHVCLMLTSRPKAQTRQALRARAYTDVPHSWAVFLSQRRRWTLGATSNDVLLTFHPKTQWFERIIAFSNVLVWSLNVFVIASIACMIVAFMNQPAWLIMCFVGVMIVPVLYYIIMTAWLPRNLKERIQFLAGLFIFVTCGPFLNITVMCFAVFNMDSFGWGKTRKVIEDDEDSAAKDGQQEKGKSVPSHGAAQTEKTDGQQGQGRLLGGGALYDEEAARDSDAITPAPMRS